MQAWDEGPVIPSWFKRDLFVGDEGPDVRIVRRKLGMSDDDVFDRGMAERVRGLAKRAAVVSAGEVNESVAEVLGEAAATEAGLLPSWYPGVRVSLGESGPHMAVLNRLLGTPGWDRGENRFTYDTENLVRQAQSAAGLWPDGVIGEETALMLGDE